jgi:hypothetical protein
LKLAFALIFSIAVSWSFLLQGCAPPSPRTEPDSAKPPAKHEESQIQVCITAAYNTVSDGTKKAMRNYYGTIAFLESLRLYHEPDEVQVSILTDKDGPDFDVIRTCCRGLRIRIIVATLPENAHVVEEGGVHVGYFHLLAPKLFPDLDRIICMNVNMRIQASLRGLWQGKPCESTWASEGGPGICARSSPAVLAEDQTRPFASSGCALPVLKHELMLKSGRLIDAHVLLFDLHVLRLHDFTAKFTQIMSTCSFTHQMILNLFAMGMYAELDPEWNVFASEADDLELQEHAKVVHDRTMTEEFTDGIREISRVKKKVDDFSIAWNAVTVKSQEADIFFVWSSVKKVSHEVVTRVEALKALNPDRKITGFCATLQCIHALKDAGVAAQLIQVERLVLLLSFREWFANHAIHKIWAGPEFEAHFHYALVLAILYRHGGIYVDLGLRVRTPFPEQAFQTNESWVAPFKGGFHGLWSACRFQKNSFAVYKVIQKFIEAYVPANATTIPPFRGVQLDLEGIQKAGVKRKVLDGKTVDGPTVFQSDVRFHDWNEKDWGILEKYAVIEGIKDLPYSFEFATLSFNLRANRTINLKNWGGNLGDEMQGFPGIQFLPRLDGFIERDDLSVLDGNHHNISMQVLIFLNAWWGGRIKTWPPPPFIQPILNALHLEEGVYKAFLKQQSSLAYYEKHGTVGA